MKHHILQTHRGLQKIKPFCCQWLTDPRQTTDTGTNDLLTSQKLPTSDPTPGQDTRVSRNSSLISWAWASQRYLSCTIYWRNIQHCYVYWPCGQKAIWLPRNTFYMRGKNDMGQMIMRSMKSLTGFEDKLCFCSFLVQVWARWCDRMLVDV